MVKAEKRFVVVWRRLGNTQYLKHTDFSQDTWLEMDEATLFSEEEINPILDYYADDESPGSLEAEMV